MDIMDFCEIVPDCRNDKNKIYSATELVFITTVSVLCGSDTWNEIHYFCERNFDYFKRRLPDLQGVPSHDTLNAFFSVLDIREFEGIFRVWINEICSRIPGVVAIDGKAVCKDPEGRLQRSGREERREEQVVYGKCLGCQQWDMSWTGEGE